MKMNYFLFGTNNMTKAVSFYEQLFTDCGMTKLYDEGRMTSWDGD